MYEYIFVMETNTAMQTVILFLSVCDSSIKKTTLVAQLPFLTEHNLSSIFIHYYNAIFC